VSSLATSPPEFRRTRTLQPRPLLKGLDALVHRAIGAVRTRRAGRLDVLRAEAEAILEAGSRWRTARTEDLASHLAVVRVGVRRDGRAATSADPRRAALAAIVEAAWRTVHLRAYPEQIMGVLALEDRCLAEMATGEGKTLTIGLAAALAAWRGGPVHVITANDYLVERDAEWLREFYALCGLKVGFVTGPMSAAARRAGYQADVTYTTSKEVVADFLRDRLHLGLIIEPERRLIRQLLHPGRDPDAGLVMRGLETAIVDEADHVLIDEAVTPLIISREAPGGALADACRRAAEVASEMTRGRDYLADNRWKDIELTAAARARLDAVTAGFPGLWRNPARREELVTTALTAREFFLRDHQYVIGPDGKIVIVDEATGRVMPQRTWKQGLHQAIEAKEGLPLTPPTETLARLSFQRFFRLYPRLCGLTGTAREAAPELWQTYRLPVVPIPSHRPCIRLRTPERVFATASAKWACVVETIQDAHAAGQPVLAGTRSVEASQHLASLLDAAGVPYHLLNAVHHDREAGVVAEAGQAGRVTIATNMAGRGTDIKLAPGVAERGGLLVLATEAHESGRVDRQLFGRSARQGEPGRAQMIVCLEDDLVARHLLAPLRALLPTLLQVGGRPAEAAAWRLVRAAQKKAERLAARRRRSVLVQDQWLEESLAFAKTGADS
jgi:preprotein translocase subunit SecA